MADDLQKNKLCTHSVSLPFFNLHLFLLVLPEGLQYSSLMHHSSFWLDFCPFWVVSGLALSLLLSFCHVCLQSFNLDSFCHDLGFPSLFASSFNTSWLHFLLFPPIPPLSFHYDFETHTVLCAKLCLVQHFFKIFYPFRPPQSFSSLSFLVCESFIFCCSSSFWPCLVTYSTLPPFFWFENCFLHCGSLLSIISLLVFS